MIIRTMQAEFGKLHGERLTLQPGLNVLSMPNEAGKSTWSEFLLAMLYGVDTKDQRKKNYLPVKERFRPWSGGEMQGRMTVEADGRALTLERTGTERAPMAQLRIFGTDSGLPFSFPANESCGRALVGAERSVYERSGFLRQQQLALTQDPALEQRLAALVTTGDERCAYSEVEQKLRDLKNRCRFHKSGLIPETERALSAAEDRLKAVRSLQQGLAEALEQKQALTKRLAEWQRQQTLCDAAEARERRRAIDRARQTLAEDRQQEQALRAQCTTLPSRAELTALAGEIGTVSAAAEAAQRQLAAVPPEPQRPALPEPLRGLAADEVETRLGTLLAELPSVPQQRKRPVLPLLLSLLCLLAGTGLLIAGLLLPLLPLTLAGAAAAAAGLVPLTLRLVSVRRQKRKNAAAAAAADRLARQYGAQDAASLPAAAEHILSAQRDWLRACEERDAALLPARQAMDECEARRDALLRQVDAFGQSVTTLSAAGRVVDTALQQYHAADTAIQRTADAQAHLAQLLALAGDDSALPALPEDAIPPDAYEVRRGLEETGLALQQTESYANRLTGQLSAYEDAVCLEAQCERLRERRDELERKNAGLTLALEVLADVNRNLQSRFAPLVCDRASALFAQLTEGRYERVTLGADMSVTVTERGASVSRPLQWLSAGTVDQLYLALRLAISELLLPKAPLVLDDALMTFDDGRAAIALRVLAQEAEKRQILLFTCHTREAALLENK